MSHSRLILFVAASFLMSNVVSAAAAHFEAGDGPLAVFVKADSAWKVLHAAEAIPSPSRLRSSPMGATQITVPDGVLYMGADSDVDLESRQIVVRRGRARLIVAETAREEWLIVAGRHTVRCQPGCEVAVAAGSNPPVGANQPAANQAAASQPAIHLLRGHARVQGFQKDFAGPAADLGNEGERLDLTKLADGVDNWLQRIRSATALRPVQGLGQLVTKDAQSDSEVRLEVDRYHVNVVLQPPVALVQIDQSFFNPFPTQQEGTFVFNLPSGASVSRFAMYVTPDSLIEGELIERKRADEVYTTIVRSKRDPAILEQIGDNLFRMRVFPIFARDTKRILLDYTVPLVADRGQYRFQLPLMSDLKPIRDFSLNGTIYPPLSARSIVSPTHPGLEFMANGNQTVTFRSSQKSVNPPHCGPHALPT